jgi:hypothetical protein
MGWRAHGNPVFRNLHGVSREMARTPLLELHSLASLPYICVWPKANPIGTFTVPCWRSFGVHPSRPALTLVESGVYGRTRNPMYVGGVLVMLGCAFVFALDWLPLLVVVSLVILHFGIVVPEEVYLERKFGHRYGRYKSRVPRYFGPFRKGGGN